MRTEFLERENAPKLAFVYSRGENSALPLVVFCGGYRSDMAGTKAIFLEEQCKARGQSYLRFDYRGHGESEGVFDDATISDWKNDAVAAITNVLDDKTDQKVLVVGSSMGGWISLLCAVEPALKNRLVGLIGIAAAPDFTEDMFHERLTKEQQEILMRDGIVYIPNDYSDIPYSYTKALYEDGKQNLLLNRQHNVSFPIILLQGGADKDVPPATAYRICEAFGLDKEETVILIEDGDHRLSRPEDLHILDAQVRKLSGL